MEPLLLSPAQALALLGYEPEKDVTLSAVTQQVAFCELLGLNVIYPLDTNEPRIRTEHLKAWLNGRIHRAIGDTWVGGRTADLPLRDRNAF